MTTIRHAHSSGLYDAPVKELEAQLAKAVTADDPDASLLSYTEVGSDKRTQALKDADPERWAAWVPGQTDVGLMWRKQRFTPVWKEAKKLTDKVWTDGQGRKHETWAGTVLLEHTDGPLVFLSVCHLPSHVQNGGKFYDNAQAKAWKSANKGWNDYWNNKRKKHHPDMALIVADWNVDFFSKTWRQNVQDYWPSMSLCWAGNMPNKGTHGDRLIDATWSTTQVKDCVLLKHVGGSDHRPYGERINF